MNKRTSMMTLFICGAALGLVIASWMAFGPDEIRLKHERIQTLIDQQLPFERNNIIFSNATVNFEGNEVVINVDVEGKRLGQSFSLSAITVGKPTYRGGSFYFVPSGVEFENIVINERNDKSITDRIRGAAERYLPDNEGMRNLVVDLAPGVESWLREHTMRGAEVVLSRVPVYTLENDTKGIAAKAFLGEVFVENGELVITFTLWRLTWWVLMAVLIVLASIAMLGAMIRSPGMFIAVSLIPADS
ncbi:MAG TPA: hypothetical protein PKA42_01540 [Candidatus Paceibacterota bacterium]|nr:hypothetical protein [Candidatus Paceibacterota bacterium]HMO82827.1 hypothetical protein [Candidatus Paceibacterota bacterium]